MEVVYIEWSDALILPFWENIDAKCSLVICKTTGYLVRETEEEVEVCSSIGEGIKACCIAIPKSCIKVRKTIWQQQ